MSIIDNSAIVRRFSCTIGIELFQTDLDLLNKGILGDITGDKDTLNYDLFFNIDTFKLSLFGTQV